MERIDFAGDRMQNDRKCHDTVLHRMTLSRFLNGNKAISKLQIESENRLPYL